MRPRLLLALPLYGWMLSFLVAPLLIVALYSLLRRGPYGGVVFEFSLANFARLMDPIYGQIYAKSLSLAATTAVVCLMLGFPMAYAVARAPQSWARLLLAALMLPFLSNFVVRAYAIKVLLSGDGPINALIVTLSGVPLILTDTPLAVWFGMVTNYLPFMVLPLYGSLRRFDFTLIEAALDLGASTWSTFWRVLLPGTQAGVISGGILVFVPTLGEFMIPDLLGGARSMMLGNLIAEQFFKARDWPFGAALVMTLVSFLVFAFALHRGFKQLSERG